MVERCDFFADEFACIEEWRVGDVDASVQFFEVDSREDVLIDAVSYLRWNLEEVAFFVGFGGQVLRLRSLIRRRWLVLLIFSEVSFGV